MIGCGMSETGSAPKGTNPHGFSLEWLRIAPGNMTARSVLPKQVVIVQEGDLKNHARPRCDQSSVTVNPWDFSRWRRIAGARSARWAIRPP